MQFLNKTKVVQNVAPVPIPKRKKNQNVVVSANASAFSNIKTGISIMIHNFQLISKKGVLKSSTEIESESSMGPLLKPIKRVIKSLAKQFLARRMAMYILTPVLEETQNVFIQVWLKEKRNEFR